MAELGKRNLVAVSWVGKLKTSLQILAILLLLYQAPLFGLPIYAMGEVALLLAAALTMYSMCLYLNAARKAGVTAE